MKLSVLFYCAVHMGNYTHTVYLSILNKEWPCDIHVIIFRRMCFFLCYIFDVIVFILVFDAIESGSCDHVESKCSAGHVCHFNSSGQTCTHYCRHDDHTIHCEHEGTCYYDDQLNKTKCRFAFLDDILTLTIILN